MIASSTDLGPSSPVIACPVSDPSALSDKYLGLHPVIQQYASAQCNDQTSSRAAFWVQGAPVLVLCPKFWTYELQPPAGTCVGTSYWTGSFKTTGAEVSSTQAFVILHELVHLYLGAKIDQAALGLYKETYTIGGCFDTNARDSRYNPSNYVFYVNSKSMVLSLSRTYLTDRL